MLIPLLLLAFLTAAGQAADLAAQVHAELNLARTAPREYARFVAAWERGGENAAAIREAVRFLEKADPRPPLAHSDGIALGALSHVLDLGSSGARTHRGAGGSMPWDRMARFGRWSGRAAENIYFGRADAREIVIALIVDAGVPGRGHRKNIFEAGFRCAGVACGPHIRSGMLCVIDFAGGFREAQTQAMRPTDSPRKPL